MVETSASKSKKAHHEDDIYTSIERSLASWRDAITEGGVTVSSSELLTQQADRGVERVETGVEQTEDKESSDLATNYSSAVVEFQERLRTFKTDTYFAKPDSVSPLIAARFGWKNTARDILTCANPNCGASLCINFGKAVRRPHAMRHLCAHYRKQFAIGHTKHCLFRYDAQSWLLQEPNEKTPHKASDDAGCEDAISSAIVPPYLLSVSPEMIIFANQSNVGVQIQLIFQTVLQSSVELDSSLVHLESTRTSENESDSHLCPNSGNTNLSYGVIVPEALKTFVGEHMTGIKKNDDVCAVPYLRSLLNEWCISEQPKAENEGNETGIFQTQESVLLATFGWTLLRSITDSAFAASCNGQYAIVECVCCLSRALVPISLEERYSRTEVGRTDSESDENQRHDAAKRQKLADPSDTASNRGIFWRTSPKPGSSLNSAKGSVIPQMDPLKSHRYFCPYVGGSLLRDPVLSRPNIGWHIIVKRMLQWKEQQLHNTE